MVNQMNCPICDSTDHQILKEFNQSITSDSKMISEKVATTICCDCGNVFNLHGARNKTFNFYQNSYDLHGSSFQAETQIYEKNTMSLSDWRLQHLLSLNILQSSGKILDIGCGKGNFLQEFQFTFSNWDLFGVESSKISLNIAKQNLSKFNFHEGIYKKEIFPTKFNLIVAFNVLEHIENPKLFLENIHHDLDIDGYVCFDVPNFKINPADFFVYDHLTHFTSDTLRNLLHEVGFKIIKLVEDNNKVPLFVICKKSDKKLNIINYFPIMKKLVLDMMNYNDEFFSTYENVNKKFDKVGVIGLGIPIWFAIQNNIIESSKILYFYDENRTIIGTKPYNIFVKPLDTISEEPSLPLIFSVSPCYIGTLHKKINNYNNDQFFPKSYSYYQKYF
jgi:SAM-dependent methyltransferase